MTATAATSVVRVDRLSIDYVSEDRVVHAVRDVSIQVRPTEFLGLAGESGCGKSTLAQTLAGILPSAARVRVGTATVAGHDLLHLSPAELRTVRWAKVAIVPQSAMNSLSPVLRVGDQIADAILAHEPVGRRDAVERAGRLLGEVGLEPRTARNYPHELSGGMRQRAVIAMAIALRPALLILDEPTTALDVITQQSILSRIVALRQQLGFAVILVSHDLPLLIQLADRIAVMYAGHVVENGSAAEIWSHPRHPYTEALMRSFPPLRGRVERLTSLPGAPPDLRYEREGCPFADRCPSVQDYCRRVRPELDPIKGGSVACHLATGRIHA